MKDEPFVEPPVTPSESLLTEDPKLRDEAEAEARKLEKIESGQKKSFRRVMIWLVPIASVVWLVLIASAVLTGKIQGIQVGVALGLTGAGLLTLLGLQLSWSNSHPPAAAAHPAAVVLRRGAKLFVE